MSEQDVTLGEVHRICLEIKEAVKRQNGRVSALETDMAVLQDRGSRDTTARITGIGSLLGGAIYAIYQAVGGGK